MQKNNKTSGFSLMGTTVSILIVMVVGVVILQTLLTMIRGNVSTDIISEKNHVSNIIYGRLDCEKSLEAGIMTTGGLFDLMAIAEEDLDLYCTTSVYNMMAFPNFMLLDGNGDLITSDYDRDIGGQLGRWHYKAGCFKRVKEPSGDIDRCLVIHSAYYSDKIAGQFKKDDFRGRELSWSPAFRYPLCCGG